jgi:hypothetical protein
VQITKGDDFDVPEFTSWAINMPSAGIMSTGPQQKLKKKKTPTTPVAPQKQLPVFERSNKIRENLE